MAVFLEMKSDGTIAGSPIMTQYSKLQKAIWTEHLQATQKPVQPCNKNVPKMKTKAMLWLCDKEESNNIPRRLMRCHLKMLLCN